MHEVKIPVSNEVGFVIGDISVNVDIRFKPMNAYTKPIEDMAIRSFNSRLGAMGYKVEQSAREIVEKHLSGSSN